MCSTKVFELAQLDPPPHSILGETCSIEIRDLAPGPLTPQSIVFKMRVSSSISLPLAAAVFVSALGLQDLHVDLGMP